MQRINTKKIKKNMSEAEIQIVSIASGSSKENIASMQIANGPSEKNNVLTSQTIFGAASLSKPVFTYLVLKLVGSNGFNLDTKLNEELPFKAFCEEHNIIWDEKNNNRAALFTPDMILSHQTGLPIGYNRKHGILQFEFEPGQGYGYSGIHFMYLQSCIEKKFGRSLEELAKQHVFDPAGMSHSSFYLPYKLCSLSETTREPGKIYFNATKKGLVYEVLTRDNNQPWRNTIPWHELPKDFPRNSSDIIQSKNVCLSTILLHASKTHVTISNAANSLHTTAEDYARFCIHWMQDKVPLVQNAFTNKVSLTKDQWAVRENIKPNVLEHLAGGYSWLLEKNDAGKIISASHTGDMNEWRAGVKLDLVAESVTVFFSKSKFGNGHVLQEQIFGQSYALEFFFEKYKFARSAEELKGDWKENFSYGARKVPANPSLVKEGQGNPVKDDFFKRNLQAKYDAMAKKPVPPKPSQPTSPVDAQPKGTEKQETQKSEAAHTTLADKLKNPFLTKLIK
jgi:CubicO group peptidase (beta-lactamase class C family)